MRLDEATAQFLKSRRADGTAVNTLRNYEGHLRKLRSAVGNVHLSQITVREVDDLFASLAATLSDDSINQVQSSLASFFRWCRSRGHLPMNVDPLGGRRMRKVRVKERRRVPAAQFGQLLDACPHPRDRMVIALGLYLMARQSEIADLRVGDVDLSSGEVTVRIFKTKDLDVMPISSELDRELRRWLTFYGQQCGPLRDDWLLVPAKRVHGLCNDGRGRLYRDELTDVLQPERKIVRMEDIAKRALGRLGWALRDESGRSMHEGMHVLRRSGARALADELMAAGTDGALRTVQAFLHHQSITMTERYLGLTIDRANRNKRFNGQPLFPSQAGGGNVVEMRSGHGRAAAAGV